MRLLIRKIIFSFLVLLGFTTLTVAQQSPLQNLAPNRTATQSSQYGNYAASNICDGDFRSFNHTQKGRDEYVQIDLGAEYDITSIVVHNRSDAGLERLSNFDVAVSSNPRASFQLFKSYRHQRDKVENGWRGFVSACFTAEQPMHGRYIRLTNKDDNFLHVAEIEVYGTPYILNKESRMAKMDQKIRQEIDAMAKAQAEELKVNFFSNIKENMNEVTGTVKQINLINQSQEELKIFINGEESAKVLKSIEGPQPFIFNIGDQIHTEGKNARGELIGTPIVRINADTKETIFIDAKREMVIDDTRKGLTKDHAVNLNGIDLLDFDPAWVANSFKLNGQIFRNARKFNYDEQIQTGGAGFYVPLGFGNLGDTKTGRGNFTHQTIIGRDKLQESWSIGASGSVSIPIPKKPDISATPNLGFTYKDSKMKQTDQNDVFVSSIKRTNEYDLGIKDITNTYLTQEFIIAIESIDENDPNLDDAKAVVRQYGTHFTDQVIYGSIRQEYVRLSENKVFDSHTRGFDLNGGVKLSKAGTQTKLRSPFGGGASETTTGSTNSSQLGEVKFSAGWERMDEHYRETSDLTERYSYVGTPEEPTAIAVGNLLPISSLVYASVMKTSMSDKDLKLYISDHLTPQIQFCQTPPIRSI